MHTAHIHTIVNEVLIELWDHHFRQPVPKEIKPEEVIQRITTEMAEEQPAICMVGFLQEGNRGPNGTEVTVFMLM